MSAKNQNKIIISFDLEFWYCGTVLRRYLPKDKSKLEKIYPKIVEEIISLLGEHGAKATFFVLAQVAQENPELIRRISQSGHEIAVHGLNHQLVSEKSPNQFNSEIRLAKKIIENITGQKTIGFRAPNFSIFNKADWALVELANMGFKYDSSLFPFSLKRWGKVSTDIHQPIKNSKLLECPISNYKFLGFNIPISGGFYFRAIPYPIFSFLLKRIIKKGRVPILYFHCMDLENFIPNIKMPKIIKIIKFWGVKKSRHKFQKLVKDFNITSINQNI